MALIIIGFVFVSVLKINLAASAWRTYEKDFSWVKSNTNRDSIFMTNSQCISFNINRQTHYPSAGNLDEADYAFVNQNFKLDNAAFFDSKLLSQIKAKGKIIYKNEKTGTEIYEIK